MRLTLFRIGVVALALPVVAALFVDRRHAPVRAASGHAPTRAATVREAFDSGHDASVRASAAWLDDDRLGFVGLEPEDADYEVPAPPMSVYFWHVETGAIVRHAPGQRLCVAGTRLRYLTRLVFDRDAEGRHHDYAVYREGPIGAEREVVVVTRGEPDVDPALVDPVPAFHNPYDCDLEPRTPEDAGRALYPLKGMHGRLEVEPVPSGHPVPPDRVTVYHLAPDGTRRPTALPSFVPQRLVWVPHEQRYFAFVGGCRIADDDAGPSSFTAYRYVPGQPPTLTCVPLPDGLMGKGRIDIRPVRDGYVASVVSHSAGFGRLVHLSGDRGRAALLARGRIADVAVSPNGCRVGFSHGDFRGRGSSKRIVMKAVDLCRPLTPLGEDDR